MLRRQKDVPHRSTWRWKKTYIRGDVVGCWYMICGMWVSQGVKQKAKGEKSRYNRYFLTSLRSFVPPLGSPVFGWHTSGGRTLRWSPFPQKKRPSPFKAVVWYQRPSQDGEWRRPLTALGSPPWHCDIRHGVAVCLAAEGYWLPPDGAVWYVWCTVYPRGNKMAGEACYTVGKNAGGLHSGIQSGSEG